MQKMAHCTVARKSLVIKRL